MRISLAISIALFAAGLPLPGLAQPAAEAPDPFYLGLLREGVQAHDEGNHAAAARSLRIACFGLLEHPPLLGECLARLAVAQAATEDREGFTATYEQLATVEKRFQGYREASLPPAVRQDFERRLVRWIHAERLDEVPAFEPLADRQRAAEIHRLPPARRRTEITTRIAAEPSKPLWRLLLAELDIEEKSLETALARVEEVLAAAPGSEPALCLRGLARARQDACGLALADLAGCSRSRDEEPFAEALLGCQVALGRHAEAVALFASLPAPLRDDRQISRLGRQAARSRAEVTEAPAPEPGSAEANGAGEAAASLPPAAIEEPTAGTETPAANEPAPVPGLDAEARSKLARARDGLATSRYAGELDEALTLAREVADAHPTSVEAQHLAAEIAYRASRWQEAVRYFRRGGEPAIEQPVLGFYMAVSLYEAGEGEAAAATLQRVLPRLERTPFVEGYVEKILEAEAAQ